MSAWANMDIANAQIQAALFVGASELLVNIGIEGGILPKKFHSDPQALADLANYVFQGQLNREYDSETYSELRNTGKRLIRDGHYNGFNVNGHVIPVRNNN